MAVSALYFVPVGIVGLLIDRTFPIGAGAAATAGSRFIFGVFETNGWHSLAALLLGVISLFFTLRPRGARRAALAIGVGHVGLVMALIAWPPETFWLASNGADQVIHASTAIGGIATGLLTRPAPARPRARTAPAPRTGPPRRPGSDAPAVTSVRR